MSESELRSPGVGSYGPLERIALPAPPVVRAFLPPERPSPVRRAVDIVGSLALLILLSGPMLGIALAIRLTSRGPALYRQTRVGINRRAGRADRRRPVSRPVARERRRLDRRTIASAGKQFRIVKFRTMVENAEENTGPRWASRTDARVTQLGRRLRRYRLDELPQLLNVLRGDMTFIGPRPERPFFVERFRRRIPGYADRLTSLPGITGLAQVEHKYDESEQDVRRKLDYDLRYLRERSLRTDLRILRKTLLVILTGAGSH